MIKFYKTLENRMTELPEYSEGCWVSAVCPTPDEIRYLIEQLGVDAQYISAALDEEESSRIESEDGQTLVIIDVPYMEEEQEEKTVVYTTTSIGIILTPANFITVSARETLVIDEFAEGRVKGVQTHLKTRFLLAILLRVAARFQLYLKQIDRLSLATETQLHRSMQNKELFQLLGLEKSLVYFSTSLKSNELTLEKILRAGSSSSMRTTRICWKMCSSRSSRPLRCVISIRAFCPVPWMPLPPSSPITSISL